MKNAAVQFPTLNSVLEYLSRPRYVNGQAIAEFMWFVFVAIILGQFGICIPLIHAIWSGESIAITLVEQASAGNFLVFATALIASSAYFLIRDYVRGKATEHRTGKMIWLLFASAVGLVIAQILYILQGRPTLTSWQITIHWILYACSMETGTEEVKSI